MYIKKRYLFLVLVLLIVMVFQDTIFSDTQTEKLSIEVKMDPRVELMSLIFHLAGNPEYNQVHVPSYQKAVQDYFGKFKHHPVVRFARKLRRTRGVSFDAVVNMAIHVTDPYTLQEIVPFTPRPRNLDNRWQISAAREFLDLARDFVQQTRFKLFVDKYKELYETMVSRLQKIVQKGHLDWFDTFCGQRPHARFTVVPGLLNNGHSYGVRVKLTDGNEELYCILGVWMRDNDGFPFFNRSILPTVVHEFCHSYVNPLVDKYKSQLKNAAQTIYPYVAQAMKQQHYLDWKIMMAESLVRACTIRYVLAVNGQETAEKQILQEINNKFLWIEELSLLMGEYETQRKKYPTLDSFFPRIIAFFNQYAVKMKKIPKIVSMIPANGTTGVNPNLQSITINFDRPMRDHSWSIVGGGSHFPQINGKPHYHSNRMILSIPVKLKPGWNYEFWLNSEKYQGFVSTQGVPLVPVRVRFKTRGK
ncbi:MAG: DUF4932 domain-containing protein [Candidatus Aminicenantes bacterium]|jgi:hypothetical protein